MRSLGAAIWPYLHPTETVLSAVRYIHVCIYICVYTHTYIHTQTHTYMKPFNYMVQILNGSTEAILHHIMTILVLFEAEAV